MEYSFFHMLSQLNYSKITYFLSVFVICPIITFIISAKCFIFFMFDHTYFLYLSSWYFFVFKWVDSFMKLWVGLSWGISLDKFSYFFLKLCFLSIHGNVVFFFIWVLALIVISNVVLYNFILFLMFLFKLDILENRQSQHFIFNVLIMPYFRIVFSWTDASISPFPYFLKFSFEFLIFFF